MGHKQTFFLDPYTGNFKPYTVATSTNYHQHNSLVKKLVKLTALTAEPTWDPWLLANIQAQNITKKLWSTHVGLH